MTRRIVLDMPILSFGRCPNCRCSGVQRGDGWAALALRGWTITLTR